MLSRATFLPPNNRRKNFHDELRYLSFLQFIRREERLRNNRYLSKKFPKMSSRYVSAIYIHNFPKGIHDCHKNFSEQFGSIRLSSPPTFYNCISCYIPQSVIYSRLTNFFSKTVSIFSTSARCGEGGRNLIAGRFSSD